MIGLLSNSSFLLQSSPCLLVQDSDQKLFDQLEDWLSRFQLFFLDGYWVELFWWDPSSTLPVSMHFKTDWQVDPHKKMTKHVSFPAWSQKGLVYGIWIQMTSLICQCSRHYFDWMALNFHPEFSEFFQEFTWNWNPRIDDVKRDRP